eukprot:GEZU01036114.1.p1 GENE.GEZU01036114.1~~GEZU01036114.1.p1  ORF type:complete len:248 (-),score=54.17 GEZU01036114.1:184-927(-)
MQQPFLQKDSSPYVQLQSDNAPTPSAPLPIPTNAVNMNTTITTTTISHNMAPGGGQSHGEQPWRRYDLIFKEPRAALDRTSIFTLFFCIPFQEHRIIVDEEFITVKKTGIFLFKHFIQNTVTKVKRSDAVTATVSTTPIFFTVILAIAAISFLTWFPLWIAALASPSARVGCAIAAFILASIEFTVFFVLYSLSRPQMITIFCGHYFACSVDCCIGRNYNTLNGEQYEYPETILSTLLGSGLKQKGV